MTKSCEFSDFGTHIEVSKDIKNEIDGAMNIIEAVRKAHEVGKDVDTLIPLKGDNLRSPGVSPISVEQHTGVRAGANTIRGEQKNKHFWDRS